MPTQRPSLVMISPTVPEVAPEHAGGRLIADVVRELTAWADVSVIVQDGPAARRATSLPEVARVIRVREHPRDRADRARDVLDRYVTTGGPPRWFRDGLRRDPEVLAALRSADAIDLQWQEQAALIPWLRRVNPRARVTVTLHDVVSQREDRARAAVAGRGPRASLVRARWAWARRRALAAEARLTGAGRAADAADAVAVLSAKDAALLPRGTATVTVMAPPVAETYAHVGRAPRADRVELLLVAFLARWANEEGLAWFVRRVLPLIRGHLPDAHLTVAGSGIRSTARDLVRGRPVELLGFVADLTPHYERADVVVVPLLRGAGVKFKVVEALSAGVPVVTTTVGAEGIGDCDWFAGVTDDPREFARAVVTVVRDRAAAQERAERVRGVLSAHFGREAFAAAVRRLHGYDAASVPDGPRPAVSVVIPAYDAAAVIERQLSALAGQADAPPFEVIVADNRSSDDTAAVAGRWAARFPCGLRVVAARRVQGVSHARNAGSAAARAERILLCDADDAVAPNWVAAMTAGLEDADLVGCALVMDRADRAGHACSRVEPLRRIFGYLPYASGGGMGYRARVWQHVRGFDESFPAGHEDVDFCWRAQEAGFRLAAVPRTHVAYTQRDTPRAALRQYRGYAQGAVLLWTRFADHAPMPPVSFVGSVRGALLQTLRTGSLLSPGSLLRGGCPPPGGSNPEGREEAARTLGWAWGTVLGHIRYRKLGAPPVPRLWTVEWID